MSLRFSWRVTLAIAAVAALAAERPAEAGFYKSIYQDQKQAAVGSTKSNITLMFPTPRSTPLFPATKNAVIIETVSCTIQATEPPWKVQITESSGSAIEHTLPVQFTGQSASANVFTVYATNVHLGTNSQEHPMISVFWRDIGLGKSVDCGFTGDVK